MKKLVGIITVLALFTSVASAELIKNLEISGSLEVLSITGDNATDFDKTVDDKYSETKARVIIGATFDLNDDVDAKVTLIKADRNYGDSAAPQGISGVNSTMMFEEAYINLKGVLGLDHRIGRQHYGNQNDLVIYFGPSQWYVEDLGAGSAIDGWSATYTKDKLTIGALSAKLWDATGTGNIDMEDSDLYGLTANYDLHEYVKAGFYYYQKDNRTEYATSGTVYFVPTDIGLSDKLTVIGVTAKGTFMGVNYGAEYAMNGGTNHKLAFITPGVDEEYAGTLMALNADYDLDVPAVGKFTFMGSYVSGSGDKTDTDKKDKEFYGINPNFRPGLLTGGLAAISGLITTNTGNLTVITLGADLTPNRWDGKLNLCAKMVNLKLTDEDLVASSVLATADTIGTEMDFVVTWNHSEDVTLKAYYAMFSPDSNFTKVLNDSLTAEDDMATAIGFSMNVKF